MARSATLAQHFAVLATADPQAPAITSAGESVTRAELDRRTNRLAGPTRSWASTPNSFVTIGLPNGIEFFEAAHRGVEVRRDAAAGVATGCPPGSGRRSSSWPSRASSSGGVRDAAGRTAIPAGYEPDPGLPDDPLAEVAAASWKAPTSGGSTGRPKLIVSAQAAPSTVEPDRPARSGMRPTAARSRSPGPLYHNASVRARRCSGAGARQPPRADAALRRRDRARSRSSEHRVDVDVRSCPR